METDNIRQNMHKVGNISMTVECELGSHFRDCIAEMVRVANSTGLWIRTVQNGVSVLVRPGDGAPELIEVFERERGEKHPFVCSPNTLPSHADAMFWLCSRLSSVSGGSAEYVRNGSAGQIIVSGCLPGDLVIYAVGCGDDRVWVSRVRTGALVGDPETIRSVDHLRQMLA